MRKRYSHVTGIYPDNGPRYADGMVTPSAAPKPARAEPRRFSIRLPRPLWIGTATVVLVLIYAGLWIALPTLRARSLCDALGRRDIKRVEELRGSARTNDRFVLTDVLREPARSVTCRIRPDPSDMIHGRCRVDIAVSAGSHPYAKPFFIEVYCYATRAERESMIW
jgi:hypothetical protein